MISIKYLRQGTCMGRTLNSNFSSESRHPKKTSTLFFTAGEQCAAVHWRTRGTVSSAKTAKQQRSAGILLFRRFSTLFRFTSETAPLSVCLAQTCCVGR